MNPHDGGPAFPPGVAMIEAAKIGDQKLCESCAGMSLRDYFVAKVMAGLLSSPEVAKTFDIACGGKWEEVLKIQVSLAYSYADEMISQRNKKES